MQLLEHIHVNVDSLAVTEEFLQVATPELKRRGAGNTPGFGSWMHYGSDEAYMAFTEVHGAQQSKSLRHIGLVVDDIEALMARLAEAGFAPTDASALDNHPHRRRVYYVDGNGMHWEFVEYLTSEPGLRNDYSQ